MNKLKKYLMYISFVCISFSTQAQMIAIETERAPLNKVLEYLAVNHDLQYSANAEKVGTCTISLNRRFRSLDAALHTLTANCELSYAKVGEVYVISPKKQTTAHKPVQKLTSFAFQGVLVDAVGKLPLANVVVQTPNGCILSDADGRFNIQAHTRTLRLRARHLAFTTLDTVLRADMEHQLVMQVKDFCMDEVWIRSDSSYHVLTAKYPISKAYMEGNLKPGFYLTYDEFINNQPSIKWTNPQRKDRKALATYNVQNFTVQRLMIPGREKQKIRKIVGYCDGQEIYFRLYEHYNAYSDWYTHVRFSGQFVSHASKRNSTFTPAGSYFGYYRRTNTILNMEDGRYFYLDIRNLKKLIRSNPALFASFQRERYREAKIYEYFLRFVESQL